MACQIILPRRHCATRLRCIRPASKVAPFALVRYHLFHYLIHQNPKPFFTNFITPLHTIFPHLQTISTQLDLALWSLDRSRVGAGMRELARPLPHANILQLDTSEFCHLAHSINAFQALTSLRSLSCSVITKSHLGLEKAENFSARALAPVRCL